MDEWNNKKKVREKKYVPVDSLGSFNSEHTRFQGDRGSVERLRFYLRQLNYVLWPLVSSCTLKKVKSSLSVAYLL